MSVPTADGQEVCGRFLRALVERDFAAMASCFSQNARFRALLPPGLREASGAEEATRYFQSWFGAADRVDVLDCHMEPIADRRHLAWRLRVHDAGGGRRLIEQQAYITIQGEEMVVFDLLCSGFRPE